MNNPPSIISIIPVEEKHWPLNEITLFCKNSFPLTLLSCPPYLAGENILMFLPYVHIFHMKLITHPLPKESTSLYDYFLWYLIFSDVKSPTLVFEFFTTVGASIGTSYMSYSRVS